MKQPKRIVRTIRQMMMNPASGVPLAHNAYGLQHFLSPQGFNSSTRDWTDQRGGFVVHTPEDSGGSLFVEAQTDGSLYYSASGILTVNGEYMKLGANDDALILMVAKHTQPVSVNPDEPGEFPTATARIGMANTEANIRVRMYPNLVGDHVEDDAGVAVDSTVAALRREYHIDSPNLTFDPNTYIAAGALNRTDGLWHTLGLRVGSMEVLQDASADVSTIGAITLQTNDESGKADESGCTINGIIFGIGWWKFPGGTLPADWKLAAMSMGEAWANRKETFWPAWGKE